MTRRKPDAIATVPAVSDSSPHRLAWNRDRQLAVDERALIDAQISSANRMADHTRAEADTIFSQRLIFAESAKSRDYDDADKILAATTDALRTRQSELDRVISGLEAAINASGKNHDDGFQPEQ